jgi:parallel beta-helix repeat protein
MIKRLLSAYIILFVVISSGGSNITARSSFYSLYYVAMDGNDDNVGSESHPWRTLQHAADMAQPGDTILVRSGTYPGLRIESSGTANAWITLRAEDGASVTINQPGPRNKHNSDVEIETWEGDGVVAYWIIQGFEVANAPSWGIDIRGSETGKSHHIIIGDNQVHHNGLSTGRTGIFAAFADDVQIVGNESYANGEHGIYVNNSSDRFIIRGNRLHNNASCGLHLNGDASMGGDGIMSDGLIESNIIYENGTSGGAAINMDGVTNTTLRNNLLYNNHASGIAIFQEDGAVCSHDNSILHNTIVMPADGRWAVTIGAGGCRNNKLYNNILYSYHTYRGSISLAAPNLTGFQSDYNVVIGRFSTDDGDTVINLVEWRKSGYEAHSFIASPDSLFVDATGNDYHLRQDSLAINAGRGGLGVGSDLEYYQRPSGGGFDIGAYEYPFASDVILKVYLPVVVN